MSNLLVILGWNLLIASAMAIVCWLLCRIRLLRERPALCHGLWLLVLVKLVTPPLIPIPVMPSVAKDYAASATTEALVPASNPYFVPPAASVIDSSPQPEFATVPTQVYPSPQIQHPNRIPWQTLISVLLGTSLFITLTLCFFAARQLMRVRRLMHGIESSTGRPQELIQQVACEFKLRSTPDIRIIDAPLTPMLWVGAGHATIILPRQLITLFDDEQLKNVLAHEVAHLVRRDHLSNVFAFVVTSLFWWNPVAWLARRAMTNAAEASCDALALHRTSGSRKSYVTTLLAVVEFVTENKPLHPTLAVTFGESSFITRRCEMVANVKVKPKLSTVGFAFIGIAALVALLSPANATDAASDREITATQPTGQPVRSPALSKASPTPAPSTPAPTPGWVDINVYAQEVYSPGLQLAGFWSMRMVARDRTSGTPDEIGYMAFGFNGMNTEQSGLLIVEGDQTAQPFTCSFSGNKEKTWIKMTIGGEDVRAQCKIAEDGASARLILPRTPNFEAYKAIKLKKLTSPRIASPAPMSRDIYSNPYGQTLPSTYYQAASVPPSASPLPIATSQPSTTPSYWYPNTTHIPGSPIPAAGSNEVETRVRAYIQSLRTIRVGDVVRVDVMPAIDPALRTHPTLAQQQARVVHTHSQTDGNVDLTLAFNTPALAKQFSRFSGALHLELMHDIKQDEEVSVPNDTTELQGRWRLKETIRPDGFRPTFDGTVEAIIAKDIWTMVTDGQAQSSKLITVDPKKDPKHITFIERSRANGEPRTINGLYMIVGDSLVILTSQSSTQERPKSYDDTAVRQIWERVVPNLYR